MKKLLVVLIPIAALVVFLALRGPAPPEVHFVKPQRETLISSLTTNGKVEPLEWAAIRAESPGPIVTIHVQRGQPVRKGQIVATLSASEAQTELASAQSRINQTRAEIETLEQGGRAPELAEIESGLTKTRAELEAAKRELTTIERLVAKKAATQAEVTSAREAVARAEREIAALERRRASLVTQPDRTAAQARLSEAQTAATAANRRVAQAQLRAPMDGILYGLEVKPGAYVQPGDLVAQVGRLDKLRVIVYVDEPELGRVAKGMPVVITWDALPGREWTGQVETVPLQVVALGTRQVGEVICTIDNSGLSLIPGTNVNAVVRSRTVQNAMTIPKEALRREGGQTGVFKLDGNRVVFQRVKTGESSVTRVQVVEGLAETDSVALPSEAPLKSGDEIRPQV